MFDDVAAADCVPALAHPLTCLCPLPLPSQLLPCAVLPAAEIIMFDDVVVVYKFLGDLMFFVSGDQDENEVVLLSVLQAFYESITLLLRWAPVLLGVWVALLGGCCWWVGGCWGTLGRGLLGGAAQRVAGVALYCKFTALLLQWVLAAQAWGARCRRCC